MNPSPFRVLSLPRELRDLIYTSIYTPSPSHYLSYQSRYSQTQRKPIPTSAFSPSLRAALSLAQTCRQIRAETLLPLQSVTQDLTIRFRVLNREDAAAFTALASLLQRWYPSLSTLRLTWRISGEYTSILELLPRHLYRLKVLELEVLDDLNSPDFFRDAHILSATRVNGSFVYLTKKVGDLTLVESRQVGGRVGYKNVWLLRFENVG
jgi:hypothetical protein